MGFEIETARGGNRIVRGQLGCQHLVTERKATSGTDLQRNADGGVHSHRSVRDLK